MVDDIGSASISAQEKSHTLSLTSSVSSATATVSSVLVPITLGVAFTSLKVIVWRARIIASWLDDLIWNDGDMMVSLILQVSKHIIEFKDVSDHRMDHVPPLPPKVGLL